MNELIKIDKNLIAEIDKNGISEIVKPLKKEIPISDYYVADVNEICSDVIFAKIKTNDNLQLKADNMVYRHTSVGVYFDGQRIGELYEGKETIPYNLLIAGKELIATVKRAHISLGKKVLEISIKMIDF